MINLVDVDPDPTGTLVYTFRQSTLNTMLLCLEQGRLDMISPVEQETDATAIGTAFHAGVEDVLRNGPDLGRAIMVALGVFDELIAKPYFRWVQTKTRDTARKYIALGMEGWMASVWPKLGNPVMIEQPFRELVDTQSGKELWLSGTIDFVDDSPAVYDWKSAGDERKYRDGFGGDGWKLKRFAVQPTVYTWAVHRLTGDLIPFIYAAFTKGTSTFQLVQVERDESHWSWLVEQMWGLVDLIERMGTDVSWPKNDQHALCSEKWCPFWAACKGKHFQ